MAGVGIVGIQSRWRRMYWVHESVLKNKVMMLATDEVLLYGQYQD